MIHVKPSPKSAVRMEMTTINKASASILNLIKSDPVKINADACIQTGKCCHLAFNINT